MHKLLNYVCKCCSRLNHEKLAAADSYACVTCNHPAAVEYQVLQMQGQGPATNNPPERTSNRDMSGGPVMFHTTHVA